MFKLYGVPLSPFVRKAMLALEHKSLAYENEPTYPGDPSPEFRVISPLGKIPVLDHDGFTIPDTSVICRYLEAVAPEPALYPADPKLQAQACWLEEFADSKLIEACAGLFQQRMLNPKLLGQPTDQEVVDGILNETMPKLLAYLESVVPESGYLVGDHLSIADLAVTTCFLQARYGDFEVDDAQAPKLRAYLDRAFSSPLVEHRMAEEAQAMPPGL